MVNALLPCQHCGRLRCQSQKKTTWWCAAGTDDQKQHKDSSYVGVKVQVPLVAVTDDMGPVEVALVGREDQQEGIALSVQSCGTSGTDSDGGRVRVTTPKGAAIFYRHTQRHRGTANYSPHGRPVLDLSFMAAADARKNDYMDTYTDSARADQQVHNARFVTACQEAAARDGKQPLCTGFDMKPVRAAKEQRRSRSHGATSELHESRVEL